MGLFSRRAPSRHGHGRDPVAAFWQWWTEDGEELLTTATRAGDFDAYVDVMTHRVRAIARGLELGFRGPFLCEHYGSDSLGVIAKNMTYVRGILATLLD